MKALKITVNQEYLEGEEPSPEEIYEMGRKDLPANNAYEDVKYALIFAYCEFQPNETRGKCLALYKIESRKPVSDRWEFSGEPAEEDIVKKCINRYESSRRKPDEERNSIDLIDLKVFMHFAHGIQKNHIVSAIDYLAQKGEVDNHGIHYAFNPAKKKAVMYDKKKYGTKEVVRIAYCYKIGETPNEKNNKFSKKQYLQFDIASKNYSTDRFDRFLDYKGFDVINGADSNAQPVPNDPKTQKKIDKSIELLRQFNQIILYGPPGTGKTHIAKKILAKLLPEGNETYSEEILERHQETYWDIVQFHPSYNYEDFVRGIKVETRENNQVAYTTVNRIFGKMCKSANDGETNRKYALIIDEINRANVSAVLGELIYALEYRDKPIQTPYTLDSDNDKNQKIVIPENLYIIGTMNTADRTIGQIDYAVRRRFAFVHCLPNKDIIDDDKAKDFFSRVENIFEKENKHLPSDSDPNDVRIGHSYFMASGKELGNKIIYQVVPILREYIKDGVLIKTAEKEIDEIEKDAKELGK